MAECISYLDGKWVPNSEMKIDVFDRGLLQGDTVFDVARSYNGKVFKLERHVDRLARSIKYMRMSPNLTADEIGVIMEEGVRKNEAVRKVEGDFNIWAFVTRGHGAWAWAAGPGTVGVRFYPVDFKRWHPYFTAGAHGVITKTRSYSPSSVEPKVKHYSRGNFAMAEIEANDVVPGGWPILLDQEGNLAEGTVNSIWMVTNGVLRTPGDSNILQSVSRSVVFDLARQLNIPVSEEALQPYDLYTADEAFVSFTGPGILPMTNADKRVIGNGKPGRVTQQLLAAWSELVGLDIVGQMEHHAKK